MGMGVPDRSHIGGFPFLHLDEVAGRVEDVTDGKF